MKSEAERQLTKKYQILNKLRNSPNGVTNSELSEIALRYGGYLGLLYKEGYKIDKVHLGDGLFSYKLVSEPKFKQEHPTAIDTLATVLREKGMSNVANSLQDILNEAGVSLRYNAGTYQ